VCLDAPAEVLFARKSEASVGWLEQRRRQYLSLEHEVPAFVVVDADRPLDQVYSDVLDTIRTHWKDQAA
jgi:thymidylate kinase